MDGHSRLFGPIGEYYHGLVEGKSVSQNTNRSLRDFIEYLHKQDRDAAEQHFYRYLGGMTLPTPLPGRKHHHKASQSQPNEKMEQQVVRLSSSLTDGLVQLVRREGVTLNSLMQASWGSILGRLTGVDDVVFGATVSGRPHELPDIEDRVGLFINTLPVRVRLRPNVSAIELAKEIQNEQLEGRLYQHTSLVSIQKVSGQKKLFDSVMVFENYPLDEQMLQNWGGLPVIEFKMHEQTNYPLTFVVALIGGKLMLQALFDAMAFESKTIEQLLDRLELLLKGILQDDRAAIMTMPILTAAEYQKMVVEWNDTRMDYAQRDACLHELFEAQVERTQDAIAVVFEGIEVSYGELDRRANQVAHYLQSIGVGPERLVGICIERSVEMAIGLLGVLKAGGAYIPIDPEYPQERIDFMLLDARPLVCLTSKSLVGLMEHSGVPVLCLDQAVEVCGGYPETSPKVKMEPSNLVYVIYTSGSTGRPKGVANTHRGVVNRMLWMQSYNPAENNARILQKTNFSFDYAVLEHFWPLVIGARLVYARPHHHGDAVYLKHLIEAAGITHLMFVPSIFSVFLTEDNLLESCRSLRQVFCGGEFVHINIARQCEQLLPHVQFVHDYGPTETTITVSHFEFALGLKLEDKIPIGKPIGNTTMYILDANLQPVPIGVPGELHIGGVGLARGYLNRPELTAEKFIPDPFSKGMGGRLYKTGDLARYLEDGNIEFMGRMDHQVKIRGLRIELGEIESILVSHQDVMAGVVIVREDSPGDKRLVGYVVMMEGKELDGHGLRVYLAQKLPEYMIPGGFVEMKSLPLSPNGKVDRNALQ